MINAVVIGKIIFEQRLQRDLEAGHVIIGGSVFQVEGIAKVPLRQKGASGQLC